MSAYDCEGAPASAPASPGPVSREALVGLVATRLGLGVEVAAVKFGGGSPIEDPVREREILSWAARELDGAGSRHGAALAFFRDQIEAGKLIQRGLHERWHDRPGERPRTLRSLTDEIRPEIDAVNRRMLLLVAQLERAPQACEKHLSALLETTLAADRTLRHLGELRQRAGRLALRALYEAP